MSKKNSKQIEEEVQTKQPVQETQVVEAPLKEDAAAQDKIEEEGVQKHEKQEQKKLQNDEIEKVEQSQNKDEEENAMQERKRRNQNDKQKKENSNQEQFAVVPSNMAQQLYFFGSAECDQYHIEQDEENEGVSEQKRPYLITYFSDKNILIHKIICGGLHTVALSTYGDVYTWGCNDSGALGRLTNTSEEEDQEHPENMQSKPERVPFPGNYKFDMISAGDSHSCCANSKHNILYQWGNFRDTKGEMFKTKALPERIGEKELNRQQIKKIISGANHLFILTDKKLFAWGDPDTSVLGRKPTERHRSEQVMRIESIQNNVEDVWTGAYHGFLKKYRNKKNENGETEKVAMYYGWGLNNHGQLGIDTEEESCIFQTEIETFRGKDIAEIVGGEHHSIALERDGSVYVWGKNDDGQLGIGEEIEEFGIYSEEEIQGFSEEEKKKKTVQIRKPHKIQIENKEEEVMKVKQVLAGTNYCYVFTENIDYQLFSWGMGTNYVLATRRRKYQIQTFQPFQRQNLDG